MSTPFSSQLVKQANLLILLCLLFLAGCVPQRLQLSHSEFETLNIRLEINPNIDPGVQAIFQEKLDLFIMEYNSRAPLFYLHESNLQNEATLTIQIAENKLVSQNEQVVGVVASVVGLSLPFVMISAGSPIYVGFYYFPKDVSVAAISLSDDINALPAGFVQRNIVNSGFLRSYEKQVSKHGDKFEFFLATLVKELEDSYSKPDRQLVLTQP